MSHATTKSPSERTSVSDLESHLGFWLRYVSNNVSSRFKGLVENAGVSISEWVALRQLFRTGESSASDLIDTLGMTKGAVSKIVTRLQEKGLVERAMLETDLRAQQVVLTASGRALVPKLARLADENDAFFFAHLSAQQRDELMTVMKDIVRQQHFKLIPVE